MSKTFRVTANDNLSFDVPAQTSTPLLQSMEQAGMETHYHCRNGFCGACRTKLICGKVTYLNEPLAYVRSGEILPCVCIAADDIEIDHG